MNHKFKIRTLKMVSLALTAGVMLFIILFFQFNKAGSQLLWQISSEGKWLLPMIVVSSLIDSINPCALSILILTIAFLFSLGSSRLNILRIGAVYILGIYIIYFLIGVSILKVLHLFNTPHFMAKAGAIVLIVFGFINLINEFFPSFPIKLKIPSVAHKRIAQLMNKASLSAAFLLGALVGICEFPCTGGPYLMVLGLLRSQETYLSGLMYLLLYNFIFILPLIIILLISSDQLILSKVDAWRKNNTRQMKLWGGLAMVVLGILLLKILNVFN